MEDSPFFYGYYSGTFDFASGFDFPLSYVLTMLSVYAVSLSAVVYSSAKSFSAHLKVVDRKGVMFTGAAFWSWDHRLNGSREALRLQCKDLANMLKALLTAKDDEEDRANALKEVKSCGWQAFLNKVSLASLADLPHSHRRSRSLHRTLGRRRPRRLRAGRHRAATLAGRMQAAGGGILRHGLRLRLPAGRIFALHRRDYLQHRLARLLRGSYRQRALQSRRQLDYSPLQVNLSSMKI